MNCLTSPWPWYIAGPLIGLTVPALLLLGNKSFGISSNLRHMCAACIPANIPFFKYNWRAEIWNLFFVFGITLGAYLTALLIPNGTPMELSADTVRDLSALGIKDFSHIAPADLFSLKTLLTFRGFIFVVIGGFLVGFGTRYASGCTSGHSIMGLSTLQFSSLIATICFMIGGMVMTWFIFPLLF